MPASTILPGVKNYFTNNSIQDKFSYELFACESSVKISAVVTKISAFNQTDGHTSTIRTRGI